MDSALARYGTAAIIQSMDAAYQIDRCSFDSKAGLFHITVLAIFQQKFLE